MNSAQVLNNLVVNLISIIHHIDTSDAANEYKYTTMFTYIELLTKVRKLQVIEEQLGVKE